MPASSPTRSTAKRALDVAGACVLLGVLAPVFGLVALCIWLDDGRPLLFTQTRIGSQGEPFRIFKFRTLTHEPADATRPAAHTTRVGGVLRRWALDELPQLWNVLRGEMSLVGPRPTLPKQVARYGPHERRRLHVRPGLTGWAQIHGRNALPWPERIDLDVWYVRHWSLVLDLQVLLRTPLLLVRGTGVYGDEQNPSFSPDAQLHV
ncbi:sugar transferase [Salinibacter altiplanensis]|uniref:sugar transferase n=1 Tax=Salinibacter altiplanensis TaxID=1803181 RepID=UPI000C9FADC8|nr:sugar transferase [Salinibacter altiplanensis]